MHAEANHPPNGQKATGICLKMGKRSNAFPRKSPEKVVGTVVEKGSMAVPSPHLMLLSHAT